MEDAFFFTSTILVNILERKSKFPQQNNNTQLRISFFLPSPWTQLICYNSQYF